MSDCHLVFEVNRAYLIAEPGAFRVQAWGTAATNATNARLVKSNDPSVPETLVLDFCVDPGQLPVLTPVEACYPLTSIDGINQIVVRGKNNWITIPVRG